MANRNTQGFGLVAAGTLGQTPATSGQGKYKIDAGYATTIFHGGAVASAAGGCGGAGGRIGAETRSWAAGKVNFLDDSFEHEVWNNSTIRPNAVHHGPYC